MTYKEMEKKVLSLIEETMDDPDIAAKIVEVTNQVMFALARFRKIPKYADIEVNEGDIITFDDIEARSQSAVYQIDSISGVGYKTRADGTVFKATESGVMEVDFFAFPERITEKNKNNYEFELSQDALEIMPYGIAADLLKSDESAEYGAVYEKKYKDLIGSMDSRNQMAGFVVEGGFRI
jgi:hypothetical protein